MDYGNYDEGISDIDEYLVNECGVKQEELDELSPEQKEVIFEQFKEIASQYGDVRIRKPPSRRARLSDEGALTNTEGGDIRFQPAESPETGRRGEPGTAPQRGPSRPADVLPEADPGDSRQSSPKREIVSGPRYARRQGKGSPPTLRKSDGRESSRKPETQIRSRYLGKSPPAYHAKLDPSSGKRDSSEGGSVGGDESNKPSKITPSPTATRKGPLIGRPGGSRIQARDSKDTTQVSKLFEVPLRAKIEREYGLELTPTYENLALEISEGKEELFLDLTIGLPKNSVVTLFQELSKKSVDPKTTTEQKKYIAAFTARVLENDHGKYLADDDKMLLNVALQEIYSQYSETRGATQEELKHLQKLMNGIRIKPKGELEVSIPKTTKLQQFQLSEYEPAELAEQFILLQKNLPNMSAGYCQSVDFAQPPKDDDLTFQLHKQYYEGVSSLVMREVVETPSKTLTSKGREQALKEANQAAKKLIDTANSALEQNNFTVAHAIFSGLANSDVERVINLSGEIGKKRVKILADMSRIFDPKSGNKNYHVEFATRPETATPVTATFTQEMALTDAGNPDVHTLVVGEDQKTKALNLEKVGLKKKVLSKFLARNVNLSNQEKEKVSSTAPLWSEVLKPGMEVMELNKCYRKFKTV